jgi:CheY-like chemotaxis protein
VARAQPLILVVDDTPETRRLMRRLLERDQFRVAEAGTGQEAIGMVMARHPALVVLDLRLPDVSGTEVARRLRAHPDPQVARTVLLACSASVQTDVRIEALEAGCDAFMGKPFEVATFAREIREVLAIHGRA